jgi:hypothetical protein
MKAERIETRLINVVLVLEEDERFTVPASTQPGDMTVTRLDWAATEAKRHSHPITASAVDGDGVQWTLALMLSDVPEEVRAALFAPLSPSDLA